MGLFDWGKKDKQSKKTEQNLNGVTALKQLNELCKKETGTPLALFQCPNECMVMHEGKKSVYVQMGPENSSYSCSKCGKTMILCKG